MRDDRGGTLTNRGRIGTNRQTSVDNSTPDVIMGRRSLSRSRHPCPAATVIVINVALGAPNPCGRFGMDDRWLSVDEICAHLGIGRDTIYKWIDKKDMPAHRVSRLWKFKKAEVDAWVRSGGGREGGRTSVQEENGHR